VLAMIEINLLPQEYRVQERTPLGLILTIVLGMLTVGAIGIYGIDLKNQLASETAKNISLTQERDKLKLEVDKIEKLKKDIQTAQKRQDAIINISQSKIVWSQKLIQFGRILAAYPDFWIDRLSLTKGGQGAGNVTLGFYAVGSDLRNIAQFRERMTGDTNFWYHFDHLEAPRTSVTDKGGGPLGVYGYKGAVTYFACTMPLK
jgi:Tfp pilus assembly protein PilN